jgi:spermidine synthase
MSRLTDIFSGTKVLEEIDSPINGKITVLKSMGLGTYLQVGGLTQSGGILVGIWKKTIDALKSRKLEVNDCLVLGLGGGTVAQLIQKYWPNAALVGVDFDKVIVELGKKYLGLDNTYVKLFIQDAFEYCNEVARQNKKFDLILVDLYKGSEFPVQLEGEEFPTLVKKLLRNKGVAVFNRLYSNEKRPNAVKFSNKLAKIFTNVEAFYPEANVMYICTA